MRWPIVNTYCWRSKHLYLDARKLNRSQCNCYSNSYNHLYGNGYYFRRMHEYCNCNCNGQPFAYSNSLRISCFYMHRSFINVYRRRGEHLYLDARELDRGKHYCYTDSNHHLYSYRYICIGLYRNCNSNRNCESYSNCRSHGITGIGMSGRIIYAYGIGCEHLYLDAGQLNRVERNSYTIGNNDLYCDRR